MSLQRQQSLMDHVADPTSTHVGSRHFSPQYHAAMEYVHLVLHKLVVRLDLREKSNVIVDSFVQDCHFVRSELFARVQQSLEAVDEGDIEEIGVLLRHHVCFSFDGFDGDAGGRNNEADLGF